MQVRLGREPHEADLPRLDRLGLVDNSYGQIGGGTTAQRNSPTLVGSVGGASAVAAGAYHSLALASVPVGTASYSYSYDSLYRLTGVSGAASMSYSYDPVGNRTAKGALPSSYDKADRLTSAAPNPYTVDADGNLTARGIDSFTYDQANRLKTATISANTATYAYDGDGKRTCKTVGSTQTGYVYDVNASLPVLLDDGTRKYVWDLGLAFAVDTGGNPLVHHTDGLNRGVQGGRHLAARIRRCPFAACVLHCVTEPTKRSGAVPSRHLSLRLESDTYRRLEAESQRAGQSRSQVAKTLLDEGLRMEAHPGIVFRPGPAGRRPGLAGGPDLWEVIRVFEGVDARGEEALRITAERTGLTLEQVRIAVRYYAEYRDEIDDWIRRLDDEADRAEAAWRREQDLLRT